MVACVGRGGVSGWSRGWFFTTEGTEVYEGTELIWRKGVADFFYTCAYTFCVCVFSLYFSKTFAES